MARTLCKILVLACLILFPCVFGNSFLYAADEIREDLQILVEQREIIIPTPTPQYPRSVYADCQLYIHWLRPQEDFCYYAIYRDGVKKGSVSKDTASYHVIAFGGKFHSYEEYLFLRASQLNTYYYGHSFKIVADRSCYGGSLPPIVDEIIVKQSSAPNLLKEPTREKVTTVGHPIDVASGNMFTGSTDIYIPGREMPLGLSRSYNSDDDSCGQFGYGWRSNFDITLREEANMSVTEVDEAGVHTVYSRDIDGTYTASAGKYSLLTKNSDSTYTILRKHGRKLYFDLWGGLTKIEGRNGNTINILRGSRGAIQEVTDSAGRKLLFTNDAQGRAIQVVDPMGRVFQYEYGDNGDLVRVIDPAGNAVSYQYNSAHQLIVETDANGHAFNFEYGSEGRANHSWQEGNSGEVSLSFDADNQITTVTDSLGAPTQYEYNSYGLVTKIMDAQENTQVITWDDNLDKVWLADQKGQAVTYNYDTRGNLIALADPLGSTTNFSYEPVFDFIKTVTDAQGNTATY
ncbi:MAG: DUF6531 domain-containing protein, partial [Candidatus Omnitrophota bacterium]